MYLRKYVDTVVKGVPFAHSRGRSGRRSKDLVAHWPRAYMRVRRVCMIWPIATYLSQEER